MNEKNKSVAILFWIAAVFIHPVRGLITFLFFLMIDDGRNFSIKDKLQFGLVGIVAPILICQVLFSGTSTLTDKSFVYYYVDTFHGFHFRSTSIETHTSNSWAVTFGCMIVAMSLPYFWASKKDDLWLKRKTILFVSSYSFSVLVQIFFTEVLPNKTIVSIGPNRFSHLGYFFLVLQYGRILSGIQFPRFDFVTVRKNLRVKYLGFVQICLGFASAFLVLYTSMDKPLEVRYQQQKNFFDWIQKNTPEDAVFATPYHLVNTYFSLVAKRSLYTFIGVAAREDMLQEQARRYMNLYGTPEIHAATGKAGFSVNRLNHYSSLTPEYFQMLSTKDKLDYVVIDSRHTFAFRGQPVAFQDQIFTVYKVSDLDVFAAARYTKTTLAKPEVNELLSGLQIQWQN